MKILVIGGAGYIGSHVCKELIKECHDITVFDNLSSGLEKNIQPGTKFVFGDILDLPKLNSVMPGHDLVIHLAAFKSAGESMVKPEKFSLNNISGTINVLNSMCENGVKKIIFSSTAAVYGEPEYLPVNEDHPTNPLNYYGFTKLEIERKLNWYSKLKSLKFVILRYFNAVGYCVEDKNTMVGLEKDPQNLLPIIMETLQGVRSKLLIYGNDYNTKDGTCVRDYIHVKDLAKGHSKAIKFLNEKNENLVVNLSSSKGLSVKEIVDEVKKQHGKFFEVEFVSRRLGDPAEIYADNKKAQEVLGWKPEYSSIENIVKTTLEAYNLK